MARQLHKLSPLTVKAKTKPGRYGDGGGLYLDIKDGGRKRWIFRYRDRRTSKQRDMGLGSATTVTLAEARTKAAEARRALEEGRDPLVGARVAQVAVPTFGELADQFIESMAVQWRSPKHRAQWEMTLREYAKPLRAMRVDEIGVADVLECLRPHWEQRPETAGRLRGRIERILNAAKAKEFRTGENPAAWRGHLENLLPARPKLSRGHHAALPYPDVPGFVARLRERQGVAALALEFAVLTVGRSTEVREASWQEFDLVRKVWTIPAHRMKASRAHRVPLVPRALDIIDIVADLPPGPFVFPGQKPNRPLSDMTLSAVLRRMKIPAKFATQHGFRSSFKDWANETTSYPNELSEAALAHVTGDATERAYRRGDALERRRELMQAWASFIESGTASNVVTLPTKRANA